MNTSTKHILQCNQSQPLADASGRIVDLMNESGFSYTDNEIDVFYITSWNTCTYSVYFKSKKELNYNRFVDSNRIFGSTNLSNFVRSPCHSYNIELHICTTKELIISNTTQNKIETNSSKITFPV